MKNISISLESHLGQFVQIQMATGRYASVNDVISEGLLLLEHEKNKRKAIALKTTIHKDIDKAQAQNSHTEKNAQALHDLSNCLQSVQSSIDDYKKTGRYVSQEAMTAWIESLHTNNALPRPTC